jgi:hypothetical protein
MDVHPPIRWPIYGKWRKYKEFTSRFLLSSRAYGSVRADLGVQITSPISIRCRSSVVEHSLGKGEVESSILSGSTRLFP